MANSLTGSNVISLNFSDVIGTGANVVTSYTIPVAPSLTITWTNGTGASAIEQVYYATGSAAAAAVNIDLTAVVTADGTTGLSHVRGIWIFNDSTTDGHVLTIGAGTNPLVYFLGGTTPTIDVQAGACLPILKPLGTTGWVVDSSNKVVQLDPGANTITYRIVVVGD